jgi:hypothetical protein
MAAVEASAGGAHLCNAIDTRTSACPTGIVPSPLTPWRQCAPCPRLWRAVVAKRPGRNWRKDARCTRGDTSIPVSSRVAGQAGLAVARAPAWVGCKSFSKSYEKIFHIIPNFKTTYRKKYYYRIFNGLRRRSPADQLNSQKLSSRQSGSSRAAPGPIVPLLDRSRIALTRAQDDGFL